MSHYLEIYTEVITMTQHAKHCGFRVLTSEIHLHTAVTDQAIILAFIGHRLFGTGRIEQVTQDYVKIKGEYYARETCTFTYAD